MICEINHFDFEAICEFDTFVEALKFQQTSSPEEFHIRMLNWMNSNIVDFTTRGILFAVRPDLYVELQNEFESGQWHVIIRKKHTCVKEPSILCNCFWQKKRFNGVKQFLDYMNVNKGITLNYNLQEMFFNFYFLFIG
jgi:hypothetical protein